MRGRYDRIGDLEEIEEWINNARDLINSGRYSDAQVFLIKANHELGAFKVIINTLEDEDFKYLSSLIDVCSSLNNEIIEILKTFEESDGKLLTH